MERGIFTGATEASWKPLGKVDFPDKKSRHLDFDRVTAYLQEGQAIFNDWEIGQREAAAIVEAPYKNLPIVVGLFSDIHYGSINVNYELLTEHLEIVENTPNFYMATNGDHADLFNAIKFSSGMEEDPISPQIQARAIMERLRQLDDKGKILVLSHGNHDDFGELAGQDFYDSFLSKFHAPIFTSGGLLHIMVQGQEYKVLLNHTYWGKSKLNVTNAAKRLMEYEGGGNIDIAWLGHTHQSSYEHFERGGKDVLAVVSGTYKTRDDWAAKRGIGGRGQQPGICVMLWPKERKMQAFKDIKVAQEVIKGWV